MGFLAPGEHFLLSCYVPPQAPVSEVYPGRLEQDFSIERPTFQVPGVFPQSHVTVFRAVQNEYEQLSDPGSWEFCLQTFHYFELVDKLCLCSCL